jgi:hypothetical protein
MKILVPSREQQRRTLQLMTAVLATELILCILMIIIESIVLTLLPLDALSQRPLQVSATAENYQYYARTCRIGAGIWTGIIGLVTFAVGLGLVMAKAQQAPAQKIATLKVVYGTTAFLCAVVDAILVASVSMCIFG